MPNVLSIKVNAVCNKLDTVQSLVKRSRQHLFLLQFVDISINKSQNLTVSYHCFKSDIIPPESSNVWNANPCKGCNVLPTANRPTPQWLCSHCYHVRYTVVSQISILGLSYLNPEIPGIGKWAGIAFPSSSLLLLGRPSFPWADPESHSIKVAVHWQPSYHNQLCLVN